MAGYNEITYTISCPNEDSLWKQNQQTVKNHGKLTIALDAATAGGAQISGLPDCVSPNANFELPDKHGNNSKTLNVNGSAGEYSFSYTANECSGYNDPPTFTVTP